MQTSCFETLVARELVQVLPDSACRYRRPINMKYSFSHRSSRIVKTELPTSEVHIVADREDEQEALLVLEPPSQIVADAWGPPVWLAYVVFQHYEGVLPCTHQCESCSEI